MLCVIAFHAGDKDQAIRLAHWIRDMGGVSRHRCLLVVAIGTDSTGVIEPLREAFEEVSEIRPAERIDGWPQGPNSLWDTALRHLHQKEPWFFLEPDAVPLKPEWLSAIEHEYRQCGKPFMGDLAEVGNVTRHMSGVAVYAANSMDYTNRLWQLGPIAWDVFLASDFLPKAHISRLIQHHVWTDRNAGNDMEFPDQRSLAIIRTDAAVFHRNKNGSLIERLRESALPAGRQKIFTYFEPVEGIDGEESAALIRLWKKQWSHAGWEPVVLGATHAKRSLLYPDFSKAISALPSVNPAGYDRACFLRWLAMSEVGSGWMCDYDVMPLDFPPRPPTGILTIHQDHNPCPSLVSGSNLEFDRICRLFMAYKPTASDTIEPGVPHCSDMTLLQAMPHEYETTGWVVNYGKGGWRFSKAVHFANATLPQGSPPRSKFIPEVLQSLPAQSPQSITGQMREHCEALRVLVDGNPGLKTLLHKELRAMKLMAKASARK